MKMPLTLEQYATFLDTRDLTWPQPPPVQPLRAKPYLVPLPEVRMVAWTVYGVLVHISTGALLFEHPDKFVMEVALDKTVQEFKMWGSMSRKPGQPSEYMGQLYSRALDEQRMAVPPGEKKPEFQAEKIWEGIVKKLFQKDYKFDTSFFGSLNEYSRKIAYFFHASLQGTDCYEGAARAMLHLQSCGIQQGLLGDGQIFSTVQLQRGLAKQDCPVHVDELLNRKAIALSHDIAGKKPSERLFRLLASQAQQLGISPGQILHVGSRIGNDIAPAKRLGMKTALFAGDKESLDATTEQLKDPLCRPDVMLTNLSQLCDVVGSP